MLLSRLLYYLSSIPTLLVGIRNWPVMLASFLHLLLQEPFIIELRSSGNRYKVRTPMDIWIIKETCIDRDYEKASVPLQDGWTILDIGAGLGDFSIYAARNYPHSVVYAYEPSPESYRLLQDNLALNRVTNVRPFPYAVSGKRDGLLLLDTRREAVQHRTATESHEEETALMQVPSKSLDQIFEELHVAECDFLKIDCEGAEYDILFHASDQTLDKMKHVCLEYHDGVTAYSHDDLAGFFRGKGFSVRIQPNPVHAHLGFLYATGRK